MTIWAFVSFHLELEFYLLLTPRQKDYSHLRIPKTSIVCLVESGTQLDRILHCSCCPIYVFPARLEPFQGKDLHRPILSPGLSPTCLKGSLLWTLTELL